MQKIALNLPTGGFVGGGLPGAGGMWSTKQTTHPEQVSLHEAQERCPMRCNQNWLPGHRRAKGPHGIILPPDSSSQQCSLTISATAPQPMQTHSFWRLPEVSSEGRVDSTGMCPAHNPKIRAIENLHIRPRKAHIRSEGSRPSYFNILNKNLFNTSWTVLNKWKAGNAFFSQSPGEIILGTAFPESATNSHKCHSR